eukprot:gene2523-3229_t
MFESRLYWSLNQFDFEKLIFIENESKAEGNVKIPNGSYFKIQ